MLYEKICGICSCKEIKIKEFRNAKDKHAVSDKSACCSLIPYNGSIILLWMQE